MNEDWYDDVEDADWQPAKREVGEIRFKKVSQGKKVKTVFKAISFILIAAVSGGISGAYIVNKKYSNMYPRLYMPLIVNRNNDGMNQEMYENIINGVTDSISPAIVGIISKNVENGSGIIFDNRGYIVTNYHVIEGNVQVAVKLSNGRTFQGKCVGAEPKLDLAVIKIDTTNLPTVAFGDSSNVIAGENVIAIGDSGTVTAGIICSVNSKVLLGDTRLFQTDAAITPENSGGVLCDYSGQIIGMNNSNAGSNINYGVGYAIPINEVDAYIKKTMNAIDEENNEINESKNTIPLIGVVAGEAVPAVNEGVKGVYIREVTDGGAAASAGLKPTDIMIRVDNVNVTKIKEINDILSKHKSKDVVNCKVWRNGKEILVNIILP